MLNFIDASRYLSPGNFGTGKVFRLTDHLLSERDQLYLSAWYHACPRPDAVARTYGTAWAIRRYLECNHAWNQIKGMAKGEPSLYLSLVAPVPRASNEPVGEHEIFHVPLSYEKTMSPLSTVYGYGIPRVVSEFGGRGRDKTDTRRRYARRAVRPIVEVSRTPIELLARLTQLAATDPLYRVDIGVLLSHVFDPGVLEEENCRGMFRETAESLREFAIPIWQYYSSLTAEEKRRMGILQSIPKR